MTGDEAPNKPTMDGIIGVQQNTLTILVSIAPLPVPLLIFNPYACDLREITIRRENSMPMAKEKNICRGVMNLIAGRKNAPNGSIGSMIMYREVIRVAKIRNAIT